MASGDNRSPSSVPSRHLGTLLRQWRSTRRMSQLDLSLEAEISARHLSYMESGKAQPSREMLARLSDALAIPLRERNSLLVAAGYAPTYRESELSTPDMALAKRAVEFVLKQQEPYPTIVIDRHWNLIKANGGAARLVNFLLDIDAPPEEPNVVRQLFRDDLLRPYIANWDQVGADMIRRLQREIDSIPTDEVLQSLLAEVLSYPHVPERWRTRDLETPMPPVFTFVLRKGDLELRFFSTWTTFATPHDVTLEEMRIESSFPADEQTENLWRSLVAGAEPYSPSTAESGSR